jgi:heptosyltransferase II
MAIRPEEAPERLPPAREGTLSRLLWCGEVSLPAALGPGEITLTENVLGPVFFGKLAVVQPLPGIGDMIWHLSHIRALASAAAGGQVTLIAKPRSCADQLFAGDTAVGDVLWLDRNPERRRGRHDGPLGMLRLVRALRARRFESVVLLHHSDSLAFALRAAGIPNRFGYGVGRQRWFLNRQPGLLPLARGAHPLEQANAFLAALSLPLADAEPRLAVDAAARGVALRRLGLPGPFPAFGIGSSEPAKQWGAERFAALAAALLRQGWPGLALLGGPAEAELAEAIRAALGADDAARAVPVLGWRLESVAALLSAAAFYVGNDTGMLNLAAAVGRPAFGLFGATPPLRHSSTIVPLQPLCGEGMAGITVPAVLAALPPFPALRRHA